VALYGGLDDDELVIPLRTDLRNPAHEGTSGKFILGYRVFGDMLTGNRHASEI